MKTLENKVAVITGSAGGIGSALALELAASGMDIMLADVDEKGMEQVAQQVTNLGRRCHRVVTDVTECAQLQRLLNVTLEQFGQCHLMINNAGIIQASDLFDVSLDDWQRLMAINLNGVLYGSRVFGDYFIKQGEGHIVNVSSAAGLFPMPGMTLYSTSKFAVEAFTQQLRWELNLKGVGVTLACPGTVKSKIYEGSHVGLPPDYAKMVTRMAASPEGFARKIRRAVQAGRGRVLYGMDVYFFSVLRMLPNWVKDPIGKLFARLILKMLAQQKA